MFDHVTYDVSDLKKSAAFYEKALAPLGHKKLVDLPEHGAVGFGTDGPRLWITQGDGPVKLGDVHFALAAKTRKQVDEFYAAAMAAGGKDNGKPGPRPAYGPTFYGAFVLDPDGFNIEASCRAPE